MQTITAHFKLITPMFMGSADTEKAELRLSSINGVLRFWFRALAWDRLQGDISQVKQLESHVFGGIDNKESRKHSFLMRFSSRNFQISQKDSSISRINEPVGLSYLGYGCVNFRHTTDRGFFKPDSSFAVKLHFRHSIDNNPISEKTEVKAFDILLDAFKGISLLGGLGSRSRRGYGSVKLSALEYNDNPVWSFPSSRESLDQEIKALLKAGNLKGRMPEYTAVSDKVQMLIPESTFQSWDSAHNWIGKKMIRYRSYGQRKNGQYKLWDGSLAEQWFKCDHDLVAGYIQGEQMNSIPDRCIFGLPHNYAFGKNNQGLRPTVSVAGNHDHAQRRASPLFVRIYELSPESYFVGLIVIRAVFLPDKKIKKQTEIKFMETTKDRRREHIRANSPYNRKYPKCVPQIPSNWDTLDDFLSYCQE